MRSTQEDCHCEKLRATRVNNQKMKRFLSLVLSIASVLGQGSYFEINGSSFSSYPISEIIAINGPMPIYEFDEVFHHYRSDFRKREPQFLGFDIQDDNIEVSLQI